MAIGSCLLHEPIGCGSCPLDRAYQPASQPASQPGSQQGQSIILALTVFCRLLSSMPENTQIHLSVTSLIYFGTIFGSHWAYNGLAGVAQGVPCEISWDTPRDPGGSNFPKKSLVLLHAEKRLCCHNQDLHDAVQMTQGVSLSFWSEEPL